MKKCRVVNLRANKFDVYVGRGSMWGNPFRIGPDGNRAEVINKYKHWISTETKLLSRIHRLQGKVLGCYCKPQACHGDILAELVNESVPPRRTRKSKQGVSK